MQRKTFRQGQQTWGKDLRREGAKTWIQNKHGGPNRMNGLMGWEWVLEIQKMLLEVFKENRVFWGKMLQDTQYFLTSLFFVSLIVPFTPGFICMFSQSKTEGKEQTCECGRWRRPHLWVWRPRSWSSPRCCWRRWTGACGGSIGSLDFSLPGRDVCYT